MTIPDGAKIPPGAKNIEVKPYQPGSHKCCCGDPNCTDFEDRMAAWGVPLDEIYDVTFEVPLGEE